MRRAGVSIALACALAAGCEDGSSPAAGGAEVPQTLAAWDLFADPAAQLPAEGVIPYEMRAPLFTDYAAKHRFMYVPEGETIEYRDHGAWSFPVGTVLIKTFAYPYDEADPSQGERLIETRLLVHREGGWEPEVYVWDEAQQVATRDVTGEVLPVTRHPAGQDPFTFDYGVPTRDECGKCHGAAFPVDGAQPTRSLGPMTGQLNFPIDYGDGPVNQIDHLASLGLFDRQPPPAEERLLFPDPNDEGQPLSDRARAYLQANCAHCHAEGGEVFDKELHLDWESTGPEQDPFRWGVCKKPTSAGNAACESTIDIVPGDADSSLLVCRMELEGKGKMAPLGRNLHHTEGVELIRAWIDSLELPGCASE